ncbi:MAG: SAM-dependent methyltransferase [Polyangia bacterium]|jgi:23S rRNA (uridine2552-2'-O)-methyltransferase|nr:SAM-dependent methyltransferase [Polyangia bacterium]
MSNLRDRKRRHDRFYHRAKKENFASRAVYKLEALDKQHRLLRQGLRVLDLGCWPGGWLQYAAERVGPGGRVVGVDLTDMTLALPKQVTVLQGDIYELAPEALLAEAGDLEAFDVVLSDMAPHTTGIRFSDVARSVALVERALTIARETLAPGGSFLAKVFVGSGLDGRVRYALRKPWPARDGRLTTELLLDPVDFLRRLAALVPPPYFNLTRYHGVLASLNRVARDRCRSPAPTPPDVPVGIRRFTKRARVAGALQGGSRDPCGRAWRWEGRGACGGLRHCATARGGCMRPWLGRTGVQAQAASGVECGESSIAAIGWRVCDDVSSHRACGSCLEPH